MSFLIGLAIGGIAGFVAGRKTTWLRFFETSAAWQVHPNTETSAAWQKK